MRTLFAVLVLLPLALSLSAGVPLFAASTSPQKPHLPKTLRIYYFDFEAYGYGASTLEEIKKYPMFVVTSEDNIARLYSFLHSRDRNAQFDDQATRLRIEDAHGTLLFLVDATGVVRDGQQEQALGPADFLRLDRLLDGLLAQYRRAHPLPPPPKRVKVPPIFAAQEANDYARVKALLAHGVSANARYRDRNYHENYSVLEAAVLFQHPAIVSLLLKHGADANSRRGVDTAPVLMMAASDKSMAIVTQLLAHGADINAADIEGRTALMDAATGNEVTMTKFLLENGADPNRTMDPIGTSGQTALMLSARLGRMETVALLLAHGADPNIQTADGMTALKAAQEGGDPAMIALFEKPQKP